MKQKKWNRLLSALLAMNMCLSAAPLAAFAADTESGAQTAVVETTDAPAEEAEITSITVKKEEVVSYDGNAHKPTVTVKPEALNYMVVIAGQEGDASDRFVSIEFPQADKKLQTLLDEILQDVKLSELSKVLEKNKQKLGSLGDYLTAVTEISKLLEKKLPDFDSEVTVCYGKHPVEIGVYLVAAISTDKTAVDQDGKLLCEVGKLTIQSAQHQTELRFDNALPENDTLTYQEAQSFVFGGSLWSGEAGSMELVDSESLHTAYTGLSSEGKPVISDSPARMPGAYVETIALNSDLSITRSYIVELQNVALTITPDNTEEDGQPHGAEVSAMADDGTTDLKVTVLYTGEDYSSADAPTAAGVYTVKASFAGSSTMKPATAEAELVIAAKETPSESTPTESAPEESKPTEAAPDESKPTESTPAETTPKKTVVVKVKAPASIVYGNDLESQLSVEIDGVKDPSKLAKAKVAENENYPNVGKYTVTAEWLGEEDAEVEIQNAEVEITARPVTIRVDDVTKVYGEADPALTYTVSDTPVSKLAKLFSLSAPVSDDLHVVLTREENENAGEYAITADAEENSNYIVTIEKPGTLTITKRPVTITINDQSKVYGEADPAPEYTVVSGSLAFGDKLGLTNMRDENEQVGVHLMNALVSPMNDTNNNYAVTIQAQGKLAIGKADAEIVLPATLSETLPDLTGPKATITKGDYTGDITYQYYSDEACTTLLAAVPTTPGTYYVMASIPATENYNSARTAAPCAYTILDDGKIPFTAEGWRGLYDGHGHSITVTAPTGAIVVYSTDGKAYSTSNPSFTQVGAYTVHYKVSLAGYPDASGTAQVIVDPEFFDVTVENYTGTYNAKPHSIRVIAPAGAVIKYSYNGSSYVTTNFQFTDVGTYTVSVKAALDGREVTKEGTVVITKATQSMAFKHASVKKYYDDAPFTNQLIQYEVYGDVSFHSSNINIAKVDANGKVTLTGNRGKVTIYATAVGTDNYEQTTASFTLEVRSHGENPTTGDQVRMGLAVSVMVISLGALGGVLVYMAKKKKK